MEIKTNLRALRHRYRLPLAELEAASGLSKPIPQPRGAGTALSYRAAGKAAGLRHRIRDFRPEGGASGAGEGLYGLSTVIGHVSSSTTLNIYAHVTDEMRQTAARKIDQGIGKTEFKAETESAAKKSAPSTFQPYKGKRRKPGTGCVTQINDHLWEGRYSPVWPDGKKHPRNVYAKTREDCERLLAEMILQMKVEIAAEKERLNAN